jgi:hypothetical protein
MTVEQSNEAPAICRYCFGDEDEECDRCTDYFTSCEECGAFGIPVDGDGMAAELCEACENPPAVQVVTALSVLYTNSERFTPEELKALADAVVLLRTHALPTSHPWSIQ